MGVPQFILSIHPLMDHSIEFAFFLDLDVTKTIFTPQNLTLIIPWVCVISIPIQVLMKHNNFIKKGLPLPTSQIWNRRHRRMK